MRVLKFLVVLAILAFGVTFVKSRWDKVRHERDEASAQAKVEADKIRRLEKDVDRLKKIDEEQIQSGERHIADLKASVSAATDSLAETDAEIARRKNAGVDTAANRDLHERIEKRRSILRDIDRDIKDAKTLDGFAASGNQNEKRQEKENWRLAHDDKQNQIQAFAKGISDERAHFNDLNHLRFDYSAKLQAAQLKTKIDVDQATLDRMKADLQTIDRDWNERQGRVAESANQSKAQTAESLAALQDRRKSTSNELSTLDQELNGVKKTQAGEQKNLGELESERKVQREKLDVLRTELRVVSEKN